MAWSADLKAGADQWLAQRVQQEELARRADLERQKIMLARIGSQEQTRQYDQSFDEDQRQFDTSTGIQQDQLGEQTRQFDAGAPMRDAQTGHIIAQTGELERQPVAEEQERAYQREMLGAREASEGRLITRRSNEDIRVAGATRPPQQAVSDQYGQERTARTRQSVNELLGKVNNWTAGPGSTLAYIPGTDARNFQAELDTLKANIAFGELTEMRAASKTGGALGQVSDRELALLESTLGALDAGQSPANLKQQLQKISESLDRWEAAKGGGGQPGQGPAPGTKRVINGTPAVWDGQGWAPQ